LSALVALSSLSSSSCIFLYTCANTIRTRHTHAHDTHTHTHHRTRTRQLM
jgi:uncharacterized UBP type Zn finger protein